MSDAGSISSTPPSSTTVDVELLYSADPYLTTLDKFISENDDIKALSFWLSEFENPKTIHSEKNVAAAIDRSIAAIDNLINDQLNVIIHTSKFKKLEASWRGLWYLIEQADGVKNFKIKMLDISWAEVVRDIDRSLEFDQSQLFQKIYSTEFGTPGGEPYGVLIGDYEVSHKPSARHPHDDITTLEGLAEIAAAAFAPFIANASSELFGIDDYSTLGLPLNFHAIFSQQEYIKWRALRERVDSRFIGLTLPKVLMRRLYRTRPGTFKGIYFHEKQVAGNEDIYLWGNASYAFAGVLIREFANVGWFGHIRGVPRNQYGGGLVTTMTVDRFETDAHNVAYKPVTDVIITDAMEKDISELGLIPLCQCYDTPFAAFYSNQSVQRPKSQQAKSTLVNAKLSAMLQHVLCASRVAHYIKIMIRDKVGSFISADECQNYLQKWLFKYTTGRHDLEWEEQARYPLREANVQVREHTDKPGQYACVIHLVPHYQIDQMISELELVTELVKAG